MRHRRSFLLSVISIMLFSPGFSEAQLWSGIINSSRAADWSQAGIRGGIPSGSWSQCGSAIAPYSGAATTINNALAACTANHYVLLGPGTFILSSGISFGTSNVVLRGSGADSTFLVFTGTGAGCFGSAITVQGACQYVNGGEGNVCDWTGGYSQGATSITIANCGSTTPAMGSISNLHVGSILIGDQLDDVNDPGTIWNCENSSTSAGPTCAGTIQGGESRTNGTCNSSMCARSQQQGEVVTSITSAGGGNYTIGISPGLYMPNWRSGRLPQVWYASSVIVNSGIENLSVDTSSGGGGSAFSIGVCNGCWVKGVRSIKAARSHVRFNTAVHSVVRDNYFYANQTGGSVSYGVEIGGGWNNMVENNIFQQITDSDPSCTGACAGNVIGYNFDVYNIYNSSYYIVPPFFQHASGDSYNLWEGNVGSGYGADMIHGTHHFETVFRNLFPGWQSHCYGGTDCRSQTIPIILQAGSRYFNVIGNVMGQPSYHTTYECSAQTSNTYCSASYQVGGYDKMIYELNYTGLGYSGPFNFCTSVACGTTSNYDPQTSAYLMRWGNYDVVNDAARFVAAEVPSAIATFPNPVPASHTLPASLYYSSKPSWFGASAAWPSNGPDVTSGNLGMCSGGAYAGMAATSGSQCTGGNLVSAWAGHANANPAMLCFLNTMGGPPDGTGSELTFNANSCYGSSSGSRLNPPSGLSAAVK